MLDAAGMSHQLRPSEARGLTACRCVSPPPPVNRQMSAVDREPRRAPGAANGRPGASVRLLAQLLQWKAETMDSNGSGCLALELGEGIDGDVAKQESGRTVWLPSSRVQMSRTPRRRARLLGAAVSLEAPERGRPAGEACSRRPPAPRSRYGDRRRERVSAASRRSVQLRRRFSIPCGVHGWRLGGIHPRLPAA